MSPAVGFAVLPGAGRTNLTLKIPLHGQSPPLLPSSGTELPPRPLHTLAAPPCTPNSSLITVRFVSDRFCLPEDPSTGREGGFTMVGMGIRGALCPGEAGQPSDVFSCPPNPQTLLWNTSRARAPLLTLRAAHEGSETPACRAVRARPPALQPGCLGRGFKSRDGFLSAV